MQHTTWEFFPAALLVHPAYFNGQRVLRRLLGAKTTTLKEFSIHERQAVVERSAIAIPFAFHVPGDRRQAC